MSDVYEPVEVRDPSGKPVDNLTAEDFTVTENGVARKIVVCKYQNLQSPEPVTRKAIPGQIVPSRAGELAYPGRRLMVLYFDLVGMAESDRSRSISAARAFVGGLLQPADLVAILDYNESDVRVVEDFTDDRARLLQDIDRLSDPVELASRAAEGIISPADEHLAALRVLPRLFSSVADQKILIWFTAGRTFQSATNLAELQATVNIAVAANVSVHAIVTGETNRATLDSLTAATGGALSLDEGDLTAALLRAQGSVGNHYILLYSYWTEDTSHSVPLRQIQIMLNGRKDLSLTYRQAYFYAPQIPRRVPIEDQLAAQLASPDPVVDLPFALEQGSSPLKNGEFSTTLTARIPNEQLNSIHKHGGPEAPVVEFIGELRNQSLQEVARIRGRASFPMKGQDGAPDPKNAGEYRMNFTLPAGDYTMKLVAIDAYRGNVGTYWLKFTVPGAR